MKKHFCAQTFSHALKIYFLSIDSQVARCIYEPEQEHVFAKPFVDVQVHVHVRERDWGCMSPVSRLAPVGRALRLEMVCPGYWSPHSSAKCM